MLFCRCGARQSGDLSSSNEEALDGILGFGKANSSMISQLASSGKVKKMFAHCLNGVNGGGIFAIGHVVQPKVNMTPLLPDQYAIHLIHFRMRVVFLIALFIILLRISSFYFFYHVFVSDYIIFCANILMFYDIIKHVASIEFGLN